MAIIYSYPIVTPTSDDLILGTDVNADGKPTKNFTVQSIVDIVSGGAAGLGAVIKINSSAKDPATNANQSATDFLNIQGTGTSTFNVFTDGSMTITGGVGTGFSSITSTDFAGNLTGVVKAGSSIQSTVTGVTQNQGDNSTKLATTAYVDNKVDPSVLTFVGTSGGNQTVNLASQTFSILGTANQIESVGTAQKITFRFPTAGVTLPNGSVATTQASSDNSTKVATTAYVKSQNNSLDLDFTGDSGTSSVLLNSQVLDFEGTASQVTTAVTAQKVKFSLPSSVTISGTFTGATFAGDLLGTINTATTGVTQSAGNNSTKIATTAYVDNAAGSKTLEYAGDATGPFSLNLTNDDLEFNGDSNITITAAAVTGNKGIVTIDLNNDVTITGTSKAGTFTTTAGAATWTTTVLAGFTSITSTAFIGALTGNASTATSLAAAGTMSVAGDVTTVPNAPTYTSGGNKVINTTIADTVVTGKILTNLPTPTSATIAASDTILAAMAKLQGQITGIPQGLVYKGTWNANTNTPTLASGTGTTGEFYIVSVAGTTNLDGITDWQVGDWAIFVEVGATDTWQKIDNTSAILGSGTANKIAKWTGSNTLATGLIADDGSTVTVGNSGNLVVEGNTTLGDAVTDTTTVKGPGVFEEALRINKGISLGANTYGSAGQVLTSGGGAGSVNTWTTPTTGTVTGVTAGTGITIGGTAAAPTVAIDYLGTDNAILSAPQENGIATTDTVWFSDATDNNIKKTTVANLLALDGARSLSAVLAVGNTTGGTDIAVSVGDDITMGSTSKLIYSNALQIYRDGNTGYIKGINGDVRITNSSNENIFRADSSSAELYYADVKKLETTTGGVSITGSLSVSTTSSLVGDVSIGNTNSAFIGMLRAGANYIAATNANGELVFRTAGSTAALTLDTNQNATFASAVWVPDYIYHASDANTYFGFPTADQFKIRVGGEDAVKVIGNQGVELYGYNNSTSAMDKVFYTDDTGSGFPRAIAEKGLKIYNSGSVYGSLEYFTEGAGNNRGGIEINAANQSTGKRMFVGDAYIQGTTSSSPGFGLLPVVEFFQANNPATTIAKYQFGTSRAFIGSSAGDVDLKVTGDTEITGNLTVGGHIIHGGGSGGGTGKGGQFTKLYTTGNAGVAGVAFTISRATTGVMVFDVMLTSDTSTACAIAKKYTVVKSYGASPLYNKILDTGPDFDNSDFTVVFAQDTTDLSIKCTITPVQTNTQKIGITLDLGYGQHNATVVMN